MVTEAESFRCLAVAPIVGVDSDGKIRSIVDDEGVLTAEVTETDRYDSDTDTHAAIVASIASSLLDVRDYGDTSAAINVTAVVGAWTGSVQVSWDGVNYVAGTTPDQNLGAGVGWYVFAFTAQDLRAPYVRIYLTQGGVGALSCVVYLYSRWG